MSNDNVTNEQQARDKSDRKKWIGYAWEAIKWSIRLAELLTRLPDFSSKVIDFIDSLWGDGR